MHLFATGWDQPGIHQPAVDPHYVSKRVGWARGGGLLGHQQAFTQRPVFVPGEFGALLAHHQAEQLGEVIPGVHLLRAHQMLVFGQQRVLGQRPVVVLVRYAPQGTPVGAGDSAGDVPVLVGGGEAGAVPAGDFPMRSARNACACSSRSRL
jgi:hypothetical protein